LAVVGLGQRIGGNALVAAPVHAGFFEEEVFDAGEVGHRAAPARGVGSVNMVSRPPDVSLPQKSKAAHPPTGWAASAVPALRLVAVPAIEVAVLVAVRDVEVAVVAGRRRDARLFADLRADLGVGRGGGSGAGEADREGDLGGESEEGLHRGWSCPFG